MTGGITVMSKSNILLMETLMFHQEKVHFIIRLNFYPLKIMTKNKSISFCLLQPINLFH